MDNIINSYDTVNFRAKWIKYDKARSFKIRCYNYGEFMKNRNSEVQARKNSLSSCLKKMKETAIDLYCSIIDYI